MRLLYSSPFWLENDAAKNVIAAGEHFLKASARAGLLALQRQQMRFKVSPKHHMLFHVIKHVSWQFDVHRKAMNPILESCAMDEDYVGRVARTARSCSPMAACTRTLQRYLLQLGEVWFAH